MACANFNTNKVKKISVKKMKKKECIKVDENRASDETFIRGHFETLNRLDQFISYVCKLAYFHDKNT